MAELPKDTQERATRPRSPSKPVGKAPPGTPTWKPPSQQSAQYPVPKPGEPIMDEDGQWLPPEPPIDPEEPVPPVEGNEKPPEALAASRRMRGR